MTVAEFDTKIAIVVRDDLAAWQRLNVTAAVYGYAHNICPVVDQERNLTESSLNILSLCGAHGLHTNGASVSDRNITDMYGAGGASLNFCA